MIGRITSVACTLLLIVVSISSALYFLESGQPSTDYFEYYGNVTANATFTYPDEIVSYTFGRSDKALDLVFINKLWCSPLSSSGPKALIATRRKAINEFVFSNQLPGIVVDVIDSNQSISQIGERDQLAIRKSDPENYISWSMGDIRPSVSSECYVSAEVTGYSEIFKIPKTIKFNGNGFTYLFE